MSWRQLEWALMAQNCHSTNLRRLSGFRSEPDIVKTVLTMHIGIMKAVLFPVLMVFACVLAGLYGALHNQISYSVSPGYFHEFKFIQFGIDQAFQNRLGASIVGLQASWWMGIIIGIPIYLVGLFVRGTKLFIQAYLKAAMIVVGVTLTVGAAALLVSFFSVSPDNLPWWMDNRQVSNPVAFARAGMMHNHSYLGGGIGLFLGLAFTVWLAWKSRKQADTVG